MEPQQDKVESIISPLKKVTPLSKYLAMVLFIIMPFIGGWIGYIYSPEKIVEVQAEVPKEVTAPFPSTEEKIQQFGFLERDIPLPKFPASPFWETKKISDSDVENSWYKFLQNDECFSGVNPEPEICPELNMAGTEYSLAVKWLKGPERYEIEIGPFDFLDFYYDSNSHRASQDGKYFDAGYLHDLGFTHLGGSDGIPARDFQVFQKRIGNELQTVVIRSNAEWYEESPNIFDSLSDELKYYIFVSDIYLARVN